MAPLARISRLFSGAYRAKGTGRSAAKAGDEGSERLTCPSGKERKPNVGMYLQRGQSTLGGASKRGDAVFRLDRVATKHEEPYVWRRQVRRSTMATQDHPPTKITELPLTAFELPKWLIEPAVRSCRLFNTAL